MEPDERVRLFCALRLPDGVLDTVCAWQAGHLSGGRLVPRENLHVTLAFLGSLEGRVLPDVESALCLAATSAAGEIRFALRRYRETRSVGMLELDDETGQARVVAETLHELLERRGLYRPERRRWQPHVTVLRFRAPPGLRPPPPALDAFAPSDAAVYLSRLRPGGAQYEVLRSVPLGGR